MRIRSQKNKKKVRIYTIGFASALVLLMIFVLGISGKRLLHIGEKIPAGESELYVRDYGNGKPPVIIEAGLNCTVDLYYDLQSRLSDGYRVIAYDHAGIGESEPNTNPRTLPYYVKELKTMLDNKNVSPPYVLIGHSLGGFIIRYYAWLYPDEIAALIFIDAPPEDWFRYIRENWSPDEQSRYFRFWDTELNINNYEGTGLTELGEYEANCDTIRGKDIPPEIPVLMFTGKNKPHFREDSILMEKDMEAWVKMQYDYIRDVEDAHQIVDPETGHWVHHDKPAMVEKEIEEFLDKVRGGGGCRPETGVIEGESRWRWIGRRRTTDDGRQETDHGP